MNKKPIPLLAAAIVSGSVFAAPTETTRNDVGGSVFATSEQSDNGLKSNSDEIDEQQNQFGAQAFALYENNYVTLDSNYSFSERRFEKESQEDRTTTIGRTDLTIGKLHHLFDLKLSHSREKLPKYSGALDLESNSDEKQIITIEPGFHSRIGSADMLFITGNATEVDYRFEEQKNSARQGGLIGLVHGISPVDTFSIYLSQTDIEFEFSPQIDYRMLMAVASFESTLRELKYKIELGQTRTESDSAGKSDDPYYQITINYQRGYNQIDFRANQQVTDSSLGVGTGLPGDDIGGGNNDVTAENLDQVLVNRAELRWTTDVLCGRCSAYVNFYVDDQDYQTLARDEKNKGVGFGVRYKMSADSTIGITGTRIKEELMGAVVDDEYTLDQITAYYNYDFTSGFNLRVFVTENERRSLEVENEYKELRVGATIGYRF